MCPLLNSFLGVFSLKTGSYTTGAFFTLVYLVASVTLALQASSDESVMVPATYLFLSALCCLLLVTCCGLVWATKKGDRGWLRIWIVLHSVVAAMAVFSFAVAAVVYLFSDAKSLAAASLCVCFSAAFFYGYGLLVVYSYFATTKPPRARSTS